MCKYLYYYLKILIYWHYRLNPKIKLLIIEVHIFLYLRGSELLSKKLFIYLWYAEADPIKIINLKSMVFGIKVDIINFKILSILLNFIIGRILSSFKLSRLGLLYFLTNLSFAIFYFINKKWLFWYILILLINYWD